MITHPEQSDYFDCVDSKVYENENRIKKDSRVRLVFSSNPRCNCALKDHQYFPRPAEILIMYSSDIPISFFCAGVQICAWVIVYG